MIIHSLNILGSMYPCHKWKCPCCSRCAAYLDINLHAIGIYTQEHSVYHNSPQHLLARCAPTRNHSGWRVRCWNLLNRNNLYSNYSNQKPMNDSIVFSFQGLSWPIDFSKSNVLYSYITKGKSCIENHPPLRFTATRSLHPQSSVEWFKRGGIVQVHLLHLETYHV